MEKYLVGFVAAAAMAIGVWFLQVPMMVNEAKVSGAVEVMQRLCPSAVAPFVQQPGQPQVSGTKGK